MGEIHPHIGPKIRFYRIAYGLSLRKLGELSDVAFGLIASYERGEVAPDYGNCNRIAEALGLPPALLWDIGPPPDAPIPRGVVTAGQPKKATRKKGRSTK